MVRGPENTDRDKPPRRRVVATPEELDAIGAEAARNAQKTPRRRVVATQAELEEIQARVNAAIGVEGKVEKRAEPPPIPKAAQTAEQEARVQAEVDAAIARGRALLKKEEEAAKAARAADDAAKAEREKVAAELKAKHKTDLAAALKDLQDRKEKVGDALADTDGLPFEPFERHTGADNKLKEGGSHDAIPRAGRRFGEWLRNFKKTLSDLRQNSGEAPMQIPRSAEEINREIARRRGTPGPGVRTGGMFGRQGGPAPSDVSPTESPAGNIYNHVGTFEMSRPKLTRMEQAAVRAEKYRREVEERLRNSATQTGSGEPLAVDAKNGEWLTGPKWMWDKWDRMWGMDHSKLPPASDIPHPHQRVWSGVKWLYNKIEGKRAERNLETVSARAYQRALYEMKQRTGKAFNETLHAAQIEGRAEFLKQRALEWERKHPLWKRALFSTLFLASTAVVTGGGSALITALGSQMWPWVWYVAATGVMGVAGTIRKASELEHRNIIEGYKSETVALKPAVAWITTVIVAGVGGWKIWGALT